MHLIGALVGEHRLKIVHVADDRVFEGDAVATEDAATFSGDGERLAGIIEFAQTDLLRCDSMFVFKSAQVQGKEHAFAEFERHVDELLLSQLEPCNRSIKLFPIDRVGGCRLKAIAGRT